MAVSGRLCAILGVNCILEVFVDFSSKRELFKRSDRHANGSVGGIPSSDIEKKVGEEKNKGCFFVVAFWKFSTRSYKGKVTTLKCVSIDFKFSFMIFLLRRRLSMFSWCAEISVRSSDF